MEVIDLKQVDRIETAAFFSLDFVLETECVVNFLEAL